MIVYREQRRRIRTAEALRRMAAAGGFECLMEAGELEAGIADALCPERDDVLDPVPEPPAEIEVSVPEGFAYYALDPELYRMAARRFARECRPGRAGIIGIRSIGVTLAAVVEIELRALGIETARWSVRPRGHPWDRKLAVTERLGEVWRGWSGWFAVVDEGPGLSGTSFAAVAGFLAGIGVADERIVLFPSWCPDGGSFVSATARERWRRHRKFHVPFEDLGFFEGARDLSAGRWRAVSGTGIPACVGLWPPVQPQHERRKYLRDGRLFKFAGYGRYGQAKLERARVLDGFVPAVDSLENGFLSGPWVTGRPATLSRELIEHAARYLAFVRREFATGGAPAFEPLAEMIAVNAPEAPNPNSWRGAVADGRAVALDARMLPHEWLETAAGFIKTDALEHHDDHFFPGPQDTAWDLAAFSLEFGLDAAGEEAFLESYIRESSDRGVRARLPFYRLAYLAFRLGYADMAALALADSKDGPRWLRERERYAGLLAGRCHA